MIKELSIKILLIGFLLLMGCNEIERSIVLMKYGEQSHFFEYIINEGWVENLYFKANLNLPGIKEYILIEHGSVNFKNYESILFNLTDHKVVKVKGNEKTSYDLSKDDIKMIQTSLKNLKSENNIYDGTGMLKDGSIFIFTYYKKGFKNKFGSYGLVLGYDYPDEKVKDLAKENIALIKALIAKAEF